jgi:hypothetical protein
MLDVANDFSLECESDAFLSKNFNRFARRISRWKTYEDAVENNSFNKHRAQPSVMYLLVVIEFPLDGQRRRCLELVFYSSRRIIPLLAIEENQTGKKEERMTN